MLKDFCQRIFHQLETDEIRRTARFKLDQHINVTFRAEVFTQDGTEKRHLADGMALAERLKTFERDGDRDIFLHKSIITEYQWQVINGMSPPTGDAMPRSRD